MTPGARVAAAIDVLDAVGQGQAAEQALTRWARASRFAGSKDRAAVRDHVFDVLRRRRSAAAVGGGESGRALMIGLLRLDGLDPDDVFTGQGHAPAPLSAAERQTPVLPDDEGTLWNLPDWILPEFKRSLGDAAADAAHMLGMRAPVTLRVNTARIAVQDCRRTLEEEGISTDLNPVAETALTVTEGMRRIRGSASYVNGLVELQDASSQAAVLALPSGDHLLDYCAGGGGKALAAAAAPGRRVSAHDIDPRRMHDLPERAARAGADIKICQPGSLSPDEPFDIVFCDAPCSGSGAWRRAPEGRWSLSDARLTELTNIQHQILSDASGLVKEKGHLVYATCSVLRRENEDTVETFVAEHPDWRCTTMKRTDISQVSDGFFFAHLTRY